MATVASPVPTAASAAPVDVLSSPAGNTAPANSESVPDTAAPLPPEVLELPAMYGLLHGAPPAIYAPVDAQAPEFEVVAQYAPQLVEAGFGFYTSQDKKLGVVFNSTYVTEEQIREADKAGKLTEVAVPYETVRDQYGSAISGELLPAAPPPVAPTVAAGSPPSARSQSKITTARVKNLSPGAPTSGPRPGAGRILNNIIKPVV